MSSEAAHKAWETRRKNAKKAPSKKSRAALLRERALKAWETRRANGWVHPASRPKRRRRANG